MLIQSAFLHECKGMGCAWVLCIHKCEWRVYMNLLHLSDLHFGNDGNDENKRAVRENYLEKTYEKLCTISKQTCIDYLFITGDIGFKASKAGYEFAKLFITTIKQILSIDIDRIFLCPGNHDANTNVLNFKEYPNEQAKANSFLTLENLDMLNDAFRDYEHFCDSIGQAKYTIGSKKSHLVGLRSNDNMNVICLNSAWYAKNKEVKDKMWIGSNFVDLIKRDIKKAQPKLNITIIHHPYRTWHMHEISNNDGKTVNTYQNILDMSDIILWGHTHEIPNKVFKEYDPFICGASSVYTKPTDSNSFQLYVFDDHSRRVIKKTEYIRRGSSFSIEEWMLNSSEAKPTVSPFNNGLKEPPYKSASIISIIKENKVHQNKIRLYNELGIIDCTEELKGTVLEPMQCMRSVHSSLSFMGIGGEKWVNSDQLLDAFKKMLIQINTVRGEVRFLLINPGSDSYGSLYQLRRESVPYGSYTQFVKLMENYDNLHVRLYSHLPSFRMQFVDDTYLAVSRYYFDKESHDNSEGGWKTPHLIISNEQRLFGENKPRYRGSLFGSFLLSYNFIWLHSTDIREWDLKGRIFNRGL